MSLFQNRVVDNIVNIRKFKYSWLVIVHVGVVITTTAHLQIQENNEISQKIWNVFLKFGFFGFLISIFAFLHSLLTGARTDAKGDHFSLLTGQKVNLLDV